ncbi:hypothetical protein [Litoribacter populi]|uniref:hypothetical protein n=1 Tax=Litoribacter populi TaxID=2598460 RepID=UPI00117D7A8A|nr:hypothetical protein [Litoribacter populi]
MSSYIESMDYEIFIRRAFNCGYDKHNSKNANFKNLIDTERGSTHTRILGSFEKQLAQIKNNIEKAILRFLKRSPTSEEKSQLDYLQTHLNQAQSTEELKHLLKFGVEVTARYKDLIK